MGWPTATCLASSQEPGQAFGIGLGLCSRTRRAKISIIQIFCEREGFEIIGPLDGDVRLTLERAFHSLVTHVGGQNEETVGNEGESENDNPSVSKEG
jgi:hypothetical protein